MSRPNAVNIDGAKLKAARLARGLNQVDVAKKVPCNETSVRNAETKNRTSRESLSGIIRAINELNLGKPNKCKPLSTEEFILEPEVSDKHETSNPIGSLCSRDESVVNEPMVLSLNHQAVCEDALRTADVFKNVVMDVEGNLNRSPLLRQFFANATSGFIEDHAGKWKVSEAVRTRNFKLEPILEGIALKLDDFAGERQDWKQLGEIVGGLTVLGIDREWVADHLADARSASAKFPSHEEVIATGDGRQVNILYLVSCALADGRSRLEKLFGRPPIDDHRLPDTAIVKMGTMAEDVEHEVKLFMIRNVIGRCEPIEPANQEKVRIQFEQVKRIFTSALKKQRHPYFGSGPGFQQLVDLIRLHLDLKDLLLIFPSGQDPELLMTDNINVFYFLGRVFDAVEAHVGI